jgi:hypothetical protein
MPISNYLGNAVINASLRNTTYTSPANVWCALYSTAPTASTSGTELTGSGYSRQSVTFSAPSAATTASTGNVTFTASANWLPVVSIAIVDASTGGNILWYSNLASSQVINSGGSIVLTTGTITLAVT